MEEEKEKQAEVNADVQSADMTEKGGEKTTKKKVGWFSKGSTSLEIVLLPISTLLCYVIFRLCILFGMERNIAKWCGVIVIMLLALAYFCWRDDVFTSKYTTKGRINYVVLSVVITIICWMITHGQHYRDHDLEMLGIFSLIGLYVVTGVIEFVQKKYFKKEDKK